MQTYDQVLDALGDGTRRQILDELRAGPATVGSLAEQLPVSRPAVSQHLKVLHSAGLVSFEPQGTRNLYQLAPVGFEALRDYLDGFWTTVLDRFVRHATDIASQEEP